MQLMMDKIPSGREQCRAADFQASRFQNSHHWEAEGDAHDQLLRNLQLVVIRAQAVRDNLCNTIANP